MRSNRKLALGVVIIIFAIISVSIFVPFILQQTRDSKNIDVMNSDWTFHNENNVEFKFDGDYLVLTDKSAFHKVRMERDITELKAGKIKLRILQQSHMDDVASFIDIELNSLMFFLTSDGSEVLELKVEKETERSGYIRAKLSNNIETTVGTIELGEWTTITIKFGDGSIGFPSTTSQFQYNGTIDGLRFETSYRHWTGRFNIDFETFVGVPSNSSTT
jgi:hypothetical protein